MGWQMGPAMDPELGSWTGWSTGTAAAAAHLSTLAGYQ